MILLDSNGGCLVWAVFFIYLVFCTEGDTVQDKSSQPSVREPTMLIFFVSVEQANFQSLKQQGASEKNRKEHEEEAKEDRISMNYPSS